MRRLEDRPGSPWHTRFGPVAKDRVNLQHLVLIALLFANCNFLPWAKKDLNFTPAAQETPGCQEIGDFIRSLKRGKTDRAAELLSEEARACWEIRLSLMSEREKRDLIRGIKADTFMVDEDINRFVIRGKTTAPTRAKVVRERGKRRLEF